MKDYRTNDSQAFKYTDREERAELLNRFSKNRSEVEGFLRDGFAAGTIHNHLTYLEVYEMIEEELNITMAK